MIDRRPLARDNGGRSSPVRDLMAENRAQHAPQSRATAAWRSLTSSKTLWLAFVVTVIGGGACVYAAMTRPEPPAQTSQSAVAPRAGFAAPPHDAKASTNPN